MLNCAILIRMDAIPQPWQDWAETLHRWGVGDLTAIVLDTLGPLTWLGAQLIYVGQPFLGSLFTPSKMRDFAEMLEDPSQVQGFVTYLQQRGACD